MPLDPEQRARLLHAKLGALISGQASPDAVASGEAASFPDGASLRVGDRGWVLVEGDGATAVGRVLAWAGQHDLASVGLLVDGDPGVAARRAALFREPPAVWQVVGRELAPAVAAPVPTIVEPPAAALDLVGLLHDAGVEIVVEHGEVRGELLGLELARIVVDDQGTARVEVGVGRHDRDAFTLVHGDLPTAEALATVVDSVRRQRHAGGDAHPLNRLAAERRLRAALVDDPARIGLRDLAPAEPVLARASVLDPAPAIAVGTDEDGRRTVVACSVGIDLDLVPSAADARLAHAPGARLVLVVPARDDHAATRRLAAALHEPADVVALTDPG